MNKTLSRLALALLFWFLVDGSASKQSMQKRDPDINETSEFSWARRTVRNITFWVAFNSVLYEGRSFEYRAVWVLLDPTAFNESDLRAIFADLSAEYKTPPRLRITAFSDRVLLLSQIAEHSRPKVSIDLRPLGPNERNSSAHNTGGLTSNYYRSEVEEFFNYRKERERTEYTNVTIRKRSIRFTGDQNSDLLLASKEGDADRVLALLRSGADPNARDATGCTPLINAALGCKVEAVQRLLSGGASVNARDEDGDTALASAASNGCTSVVRMLVRKGAEIDTKNNDGYSALLLATARGQVPTVRILLASHARPDLANNQGETPLMLARGRHLDDLVELLLTYKAKK
jgi:hypothetical protein